MPKAVYYSQKYKHKNDDKRMNTTEMAAVRVARRKSKAGPVLMVACLAVAILCVLLVPMLLGGAEPVRSAEAHSGDTSRSEEAFGEVGKALEALDIAPALPTALPEGCALTSCTVVDGDMLEVGISYGRGGMLFRTAAGNDDLTGANYEQYGYTINETVDGITRGYAGVSEKKLNLAVWTDGDYSYALVAENGLDAEVMHAIAESIA